MEHFFIGIVEDNNDPLKVGRCRVRIPAIHTSSKKDIPTKHLPWFSLVKTPGIQAVKPPEIGDQVKLTPLDDSLQQFLIDGVIPGIGTEPDTSRLARNESISDTIVQSKKNNKLTGEPDSSYAAKYPYNFSWETPGGCVFELDDTPGAKRIHFYHPSGSYQEFNASGDMTFRSVGTMYIVNSTMLDIYCPTTITGPTIINGAFTVNSDLLTISNGNIHMYGYGVIDGGLTVTGTITATENIIASFSDENLKTIQGYIVNALDKVCTLDTFYYTPNETALELGAKDGMFVGLSAQQVQKVMPEAVAPSPLSSEYLTIKKEDLIPYLVESIKELRKEIEELKK